jgi:hypothetical protein
MSKPSQREKLRDAEGSGAFFVAVSAVEAYASVVGFAPEDAVAIIHDYFTSEELCESCREAERKAVAEAAAVETGVAS